VILGVLRWLGGIIQDFGDLCCIVVFCCGFRSFGLGVCVYFGRFGIC